MLKHFIFFGFFYTFFEFGFSREFKGILPAYPDKGQVSHKSWPHPRVVSYDAFEVPPFSDFILYTTPRTSYSLQISLQLNPQNSTIQDFTSYVNKTSVKIIPAFMYYLLPPDTCFSNETVGGNKYLYNDYCCDKKPGKEGRLFNCTIKEIPKYFEYINTNDFLSDTIEFNSISYENQGLDFVDLGRLILESFKISDKRVRFADYVNYFVVVENHGNETLEFFQGELNENSDEYVTLSYWFFSTMVFSPFGFISFVLFWCPLFCCCGGCIFGISALIVCKRAGGIKEEEIEEEKVNEKDTNYNMIIKERLLEVKQIRKEYFSLYDGFKENKAKSCGLLIASFIKYIINGETLLEMLFLILDKCCFICRCEKYIKSKYYQRSEKCFELIRDEERDKHNFYFTKKLVYFCIVVMISFFSSLIIESYVVESFVLPTECTITSFAEEIKADTPISITEPVQFYKRSEGDYEMYFNHPKGWPKSLMKVGGIVELNPNTLNPKFPFESYYERVMYSEYSYLACQIPPINLTDPRPTCNKSVTPLEMYVKSPAYACNPVAEQFDFWFYKFLCSAVSFALLFIPLLLFEKAYYWLGGPFCFGSCCKRCVKDRGIIRNYKRKNCCTGCCFVISIVVGLWCLGAVIYQISVRTNFTLLGVFASFCVTAVNEVGYEITLLVIKYFCCCGWKNVRKLEKSIDEVVKETKTLEKSSEKKEETLVNKDDLKNVELKSTQKTNENEKSESPESKEENEEEEEEKEEEN